MSTNFLEALEANAKLPANAGRPLSVAGQVRLRLPDIEEALARGYTHRQILRQLNRYGIDLSAAYYHRLIPKLRAETRARVIPIDSEVRGAVLKLTQAGTEKALVPLAASLPAGPPPADVQANTNSDDLSIAFAAKAVVKPRTISGRQADAPKFKWDPRGAEKFDPNNL